MLHNKIFGQKTLTYLLSWFLFQCHQCCCHRLSPSFLPCYHPPCTAKNYHFKLFPMVWTRSQNCSFCNYKEQLESYVFMFFLNPPYWSWPQTILGYSSQKLHSIWCCSICFFSREKFTIKPLISIQLLIPYRIHNRPYFLIISILFLKNNVNKVISPKFKR